MAFLSRHEYIFESFWYKSLDIYFLPHVIQQWYLSWDEGISTVLGLINDWLLHAIPIRAKTLKLLKINNKNNF